MRISGLIVALLVLTGCQSLTRNNDNAGEPEQVTPVAKIERGLCLFVEPPQGFEHNCDATYWLNAWIDNSFFENRNCWVRYSTIYVTTSFKIK